MYKHSDDRPLPLRPQWRNVFYFKVFIDLTNFLNYLDDIK